MRLYAFLGQSLAAQGQPQHRYSQWVDTYTSDQFESLAQQLEQLVDNHATDTPLMRRTYRYAMECELNFFEAAWTVIV
jgi:thiaminase/transcriptional activator TenA